jgi:hypothetical protein
VTNRSTRTVAAFAAIAALALGGGVPAAMARHGADDPPGHDVGDDHGGDRSRASVARHRSDDHGRDRGRRHDDGPNHR